MAKAKNNKKILDAFNEYEYEHEQEKEEDLFWELEKERLSDENELQKVKLLKEKLRKVEEELAEKSRLINNQRKQLEESLRALEEREKKSHELEILLKTMEANLHQMESERRQYLGKIEEHGREVAGLQDKCIQYEEDLKNLTGQLRARTQENILLNKENKDLQRVNNQLRETVALSEEKIRSLEQELSQLGPAKAELEKKFNRALDSLRNEVKAKHQEILRLNKEVADLKKAHQDIQRINDNLELELDMLNTTNVSLQKKIEKLILQNSILEKKLQNRLVRFVLGLCALFGWNPERKVKSLGV
ncbi:MAG: hypothetical protein QHH75_00810 [Bacillota bacterium]|nr:hypothetical protein [Bacillota bacterium]